MHIHILGICGTFMGGLAALANEAGHRVTGCDSSVYPPMSDQLESLGIKLIEGFGVEQLQLKPDLFVVGNVISRSLDHQGAPKFPLMEAILNAGLPYTSGPQWLSEHILQGRHVLAVAGTHGKTTTTAMLAWIMEEANLSPGFLIGGVPMNFPHSARLGRGKGTEGQPSYFVIEADEYDTAFFDKRSKFIHYKARTVILNNLEFDHADIFDDLASIERQFQQLIRTIPSNGRVVVNGLEESLNRVLHMGCWSEVSSFGSAVSEFTTQGEPNNFQVFYRNQPAGHIKWSLTGQHNLLNALAAISAAEHIGIPPIQSCAALTHFQNVKRRMEVCGVVYIDQLEVTIYNDFAHHPTAIRTTIEGLRQKVGQQRILVVFEPRSNTMKLGIIKAQLPGSLEAANFSFCYTPNLEWDARKILSSLGDKAFISNDLDDLVDNVSQIAKGGDHIICMSNGGFGGVHQKLLDRLKFIHKTPENSHPLINKI